MTQVLPEEIDLPERAHDIRGEVFGSLTAIRPVGNNRYGVLWLCECACGRKALRSVARLRYAAKTNVESQCVECQRELRGGIFQDRSEALRELYMLHWYQRGSLYSEEQLDRIKQKICDDLMEIGLPIEEPVIDEFDGCDLPEQPDPYIGTVDGEPPRLLGEIGIEFDLSRERVRQVLLRAFDKLRQGPHKRLLMSLLYGEYDWRIASLERVQRLKAEVTFSGCRCERYERSAPGYVYCRTCGQVWRVSAQQELQVITRSMLKRSTIED